MPKLELTDNTESALGQLFPPLAPEERAQLEALAHRMGGRPPSDRLPDQSIPAALRSGPVDLAAMERGEFFVRSADGDGSGQVPPLTAQALRYFMRAQLAPYAHQPDKCLAPIGNSADEERFNAIARTNARVYDEIASWPIMKPTATSPNVSVVQLFERKYVTYTREALRPRLGAPSTNPPLEQSDTPTFTFVLEQPMVGGCRLDSGFVLIPSNGEAGGCGKDDTETDDGSYSQLVLFPILVASSSTARILPYLTFRDSDDTGSWNFTFYTPDPLEPGTTLVVQLMGIRGIANSTPLIMQGFRRRLYKRDHTTSNRAVVNLDAHVRLDTLYRVGSGWETTCDTKLQVTRSCLVVSRTREWYSTTGFTSAGFVGPSGEIVPLMIGGSTPLNKKLPNAHLLIDLGNSPHLVWLMAAPKRLPDKGSHMRIINGAFVDWPHFGLVNDVMRNLPDLLTQLGEGASDLNASFEALSKEVTSGSHGAATLSEEELRDRMLLHCDYKGYLPASDDLDEPEEDLFKHHSVSRSRKILRALHRLIGDKAFMQAYVSVVAPAFKYIPPSEVQPADDGVSFPNHHVSPGAVEASQTADCAVAAAQEKTTDLAEEEPSEGEFPPRGTKRAAPTPGDDNGCVGSATKRFAAGN